MLEAQLSDELKSKENIEKMHHDLMEKLQKSELERVQIEENFDKHLEKVANSTKVSS